LICSVVSSDSEPSSVLSGQLSFLGEFLCETALDQETDAKPENFEDLSDDEKKKVRSWKTKIESMVSEFSNGIDRDRKLRSKGPGNTSPRKDNWTDKTEEGSESEETTEQIKERLGALL